MSRRLRLSIASLIVSPLLLLCACGGSSNSSDGNSTSGSGAAQSAAAAKTALATAGWLDPINSIGIDEPLTTTPSGKKIAIAQCGVDTCAQIASGITAAAKTLGWSTKPYDTGTTPDAAIAAFKQIVADKPDVVVVMSVAVQTVQTQLRQLKQQGAVIVSTGVDTPSKDLIDAAINNNALDTLWGKGMADYMISDTGGALHGLYLGVPFFPFSVALGRGLTDETPHICPSCSVKELDVNPQDIGRKVPQQVVSYLQANPATNYVAVPFGDLAIGVPEALQAAGLADQVKIISLAGGKVNYQYIKAGQQRADMALDTRLNGWYVVDAAARLISHQTPPDYDSIRRVQILTEIDWNPASEPYVAIKGYEAQFASLWHV